MTILSTRFAIVDSSTRKRFDLSIFLVREFEKDAINRFSVYYNYVGDISETTRSLPFAFSSDVSCFIFFSCFLYSSWFLYFIYASLFVILNGWTVSMVLTVNSLFLLEVSSPWRLMTPSLAQVHLQTLWFHQASYLEDFLANVRAFPAGISSNPSRSSLPKSGKDDDDSRWFWRFCVKSGRS